MARKKATKKCKIPVEIDHDGNPKDLWTSFLKIVRAGDVLRPTSCLSCYGVDADGQKYVEFYSRKKIRVPLNHCFVVTADEKGKLYVIMPDGMPYTLARFGRMARNASKMSWSENIPYVIDTSVQTSCAKSSQT